LPILANYVANGTALAVRQPQRPSLLQRVAGITNLLVVDTGMGTSDQLNVNNMGDMGTMPNETRAWNLTKASLVGDAMQACVGPRPCA
jgi:hypothetical protein